MIENVVITAAGLGTRMSPATKEVPKEMLPIFSSGKKGELIMKPLCQAVFEQLFEVGVRRFVFIINKQKGSLHNHFTYDINYPRDLSEKGKYLIAEEILEFYEQLNFSSLIFVNQSEPLGFGDAVFRAKPHIHEPFLVHAGDTFILSKANSHLKRLIKAHNEFKSEVTILVDEVKNPSAFGIIEGSEIGHGIYDLKKVIEKPSARESSSNLAITGIYVFDTILFDALKYTPRGLGGELQLTDGIQKLLDSGVRGIAVKLRKNENWLDIGTPQTYWLTLRQTRDFANSLRERMKVAVMKNL